MGKCWTAQNVMHKQVSLVRQSELVAQTIIPNNLHAKLNSLSNSECKNFTEIAAPCTKILVTWKSWLYISGMPVWGKTTTKQEVGPMLERFVRTQKWKTWLWSQVHIYLFRCDVETFRPTILFASIFSFYIYLKPRLISWRQNTYQANNKGLPGLMFGAPHWESVGTACKHLVAQQFKDVLFMLQSHLTMTFSLIHLSFQSLFQIYYPSIMCHQTKFQITVVNMLSKNEC